MIEIKPLFGDWQEVPIEISYLFTEVKRKVEEVEK